MLKATQAERVLLALQTANGNWVGGQYFLREMFLSQYHARLWELQHNKEKYSYEGIIEASPFTDEFGFRAYRLRVEPKQEALL